MSRLVPLSSSSGPLLGLILALAPACGEGDHGAADTDSGPMLPAADGGSNDADDAEAAAPMLPICAETASGPTRGSTIALSADNRTLVALTRGYDGYVSVFDLDPETIPVTAAPPRYLWVGAELSQLAIDACGTRAYVLLRKNQTLLEIVDLKGDPRTGREVAVGSEPTGLALSPNNQFLYVANWVDGTVSVIDVTLPTWTQEPPVNLNPALAATGVLGSAMSTSRRPALAHPRSVAITNDGDADDSDETVLVTEFFSQRFLAHEDNATNADVNRRGYLYAISAADHTVQPVELPPMDDTGFRLSETAPTGCFPNQVQAVTIHGDGDFAYVASICASPEGPTGATPIRSDCTSDAQCEGEDGTRATCDADGKCARLGCTTDAFCRVGLLAESANRRECASGRCIDVLPVKTTTHSTVHAVDLRTSPPTAAPPVNLNKLFDDFANELAFPDDATRRYPLVVSDIAFLDEGGVSVGYFSANGADAIFRAEVDPQTGAVVRVGDRNLQKLFIDLGLYGAQGSDTLSAGQNPIGVTIAPLERPVAFVNNDITANISVVDLTTQSVVGSELGPDRALILDMPPGELNINNPELNRGRRFFNTGLGRWSLKGQAWSSCQSCHFDGYTDNVTWYAARGSRQSVSLDGSFDKEGGPNRIYNWTAIFDEIEDFEDIGRALQGAVGALVTVDATPAAYAHRIELGALGAAGLNGSSHEVWERDRVLSDWQDIGVWLRVLRPPKAPTNLSPKSVTEGERLFWNEAQCHACHAGPPLWTISRRFYTPSTETNTALLTTPYEVPPDFPMDLAPTLVEAQRTLRSPSAFVSTEDQIQCVLRNVGTYGVSAPDVNIAELRGNMATPSQGDGNPPSSPTSDPTSDEVYNVRGFNVPSLYGLSVGAPYFHAGNARSLEELLSEIFDKHRRAFNADPEVWDNPKAIENLVHYLLSIDGDTRAPDDLMSTVPRDGVRLCPDSFSVSADAGAP